jgi:hypothetical protein
MGVQTSHDVHKPLVGVTVDSSSTPPAVAAPPPATMEADAKRKGIEDAKQTDLCSKSVSGAALVWICAVLVIFFTLDMVDHNVYVDLHEP